MPHSETNQSSEREIKTTKVVFGERGVSRYWRLKIPNASIYHSGVTITYMPGHGHPRDRRKHKRIGNDGTRPSQNFSLFLAAAAVVSYVAQRLKRFRGWGTHNPHNRQHHSGHTCDVDDCFRFFFVVGGRLSGKSDGTLHKPTLP